MLKKMIVLSVACFIMQLTAHAQETLIYHVIKTNKQGHIIPWYNEEPGKSYSHIIQSIWHFWDTMRTDLNGLPYYMNHQVWKPGVDDSRGIGGDQFAMALSSWQLLYAYTGDERIKEDMKFIADYYVSHGLSSSNCEWAGIPFPYNTLIYSGIYDGDMVIGKNFTQPDKAGSFGNELINLYKLVGTRSHGQTPAGIYLETAIQIANTLAKHITTGDKNNSPLPFKVNAVTGEIGKLKDNAGSSNDAALSTYTSNWSGTMEMYLNLIALNKGDVASSQKAFDILLAWMKKYPLQNNKWGPFFEDVPGWSDTQINAITFAQFIMNHPQYFPEWRTNVKNIFNWVYSKLGNDTWKKYGVTVVNEQTAYMVPGNSHTSRQASAELQYTALSGDSSYKQNAIRQLNWATYMVDNDGKNRYPQDDNWLTDGYGDYVRHYLRAMAAIPALAPSDEEHILSSTSVIQQADYPPFSNKLNEGDTENINVKKLRLRYITYDKTGQEKIRLLKKPTEVLLNNTALKETANTSAEGYTWVPFNKGGLLIINRLNGNNILVSE